MRMNKKIVGLLSIILLFGISNYFFNSLRIFSNDMAPTIDKGSFVISLNTKKVQTGDIIIYQRENKIYVKRVVGLAGQTIDMDKNGNLFVDDQFVSEPYIEKHSLHPLSVSLPITVADDSYFVLGDNRVESMDSRLDLVGQVKKEEILGKAVFCVYPFESFGIIHNK